MSRSPTQHADEPALKAPFPAFGGKRRIAAEVWKRFGPDHKTGGVRNYIEPFCFSAAVLLGRPGGPGAVETINDRNGYVVNFWRAVAADPDSVAEHCDWPVSEIDMHARHRYLQSDEAAASLHQLRTDPDHYDARIAGWWCWGACCWIGSGWCDERPHTWDGESRRITWAADGLGRGFTRKRPDVGRDGKGKGIVRPPTNIPHLDSLGAGGGGVAGRPQLGDKFARGRGVNSNDTASTIDERRGWIGSWMRRLSDRLRPVRVCAGHWSRVCDSHTTMTRLGITGVFLDPPYRKTLADGSTNRTGHIYASDRTQDIDRLCDEVMAWCLKWASNPQVRIALCGLEGEYPEIESTIGQHGGWTVLEWASGGGYGNRSAENVNRHRERVWFSPHCLREDHTDSPSLFETDQ